MSHSPQNPADTAPPPGQNTMEDKVNSNLIVAVGVVSLVVFALSAVIALIIYNKDVAKYDERGIAPPALGLIKKPEIGIVDNITFESDNRLDVWRAEKHKALNGYGWIDRSKGIIHIPIDEAMKDVVRQASAGGGNK